MAQAQAIELTVPLFGDRYLKMYWTVQGTAPIPVRWAFTGEWDAIRAERYLQLQFKYRHELTFKREGASILMELKVDDRAGSESLEDTAS